MPRPARVNLAVPKRALAIGAHPDDIEFGAGATLAKWAAKGCEIFHVVCTDGSKGSWDASQDRAELVAIRQREQREASRRLGGKGDVAFLGWPDGELEAGLRQRWEIAYWIRRFQPDVVFGHDPWKRYRLHPDHRNAGFLTVDGVVAARDPHFFPEQDLRPHRPEVLLLFEADAPDHVEDASGWAETKVAALLEHRSQLRSTMNIDDLSDLAQVAAFAALVRQRLAEAGASANFDLGEAFAALDPSH
jgi:LmbE family N-acetylglucosaminyl deacetylase